MTQQFTVSEGGLTITQRSLTRLSTMWNVHHGVQMCSTAYWIQEWIP
jgi:hypothetical protein